MRQGIFDDREWDKMRAIDYLKGLPYLPSSKEGRQLGRPSRSELKRWLRKGSVLINGEYPGVGEEIILPIYQLVFFPSSKSRCTMANWQPQELGSAVNSGDLLPGYKEHDFSVAKTEGLY